MWELPQIQDFTVKILGRNYIHTLKNVGTNTNPRFYCKNLRSELHPYFEKRGNYHQVKVLRTNSKIVGTLTFR